MKRNVTKEQKETISQTSKQKESAMKTQTFAELMLRARQLQPFEKVQIALVMERAEILTRMAKLEIANTTRLLERIGVLK